MREATEKRDYTRYTVKDMERFFKRKTEKRLSAYAAAKQLGISIRTCQRWVKKYAERGDSFFESLKKPGRKPTLTEERSRNAITGFINGKKLTWTLRQTAYSLTSLTIINTYACSALLTINFYSSTFKYYSIQVLTLASRTYS